MWTFDHDFPSRGALRAPQLVVNSRDERSVRFSHTLLCFLKRVAALFDAARPLGFFLDKLFHALLSACGGGQCG